MCRLLWEWSELWCVRREVRELRHFAPATHLRSCWPRLFTLYKCSSKFSLIIKWQQTHRQRHYSYCWRCRDTGGSLLLQVEVNLRISVLKARLKMMFLHLLKLYKLFFFLIASRTYFCLSYIYTNHSASWFSLMQFFFLDKSGKAMFEELSLWITARMLWTTGPLPVLSPVVLKFIFADSPFPKPLYHPFSWIYFCSMSKQGPSPSIRGFEPSGRGHKFSGVICEGFYCLSYLQQSERR